MHIRLIAVGDRQPAWVDEAFGIYTGRFRENGNFAWTLSRPPDAARATSRIVLDEAEGEHILAKLGSNEQVVLLDERGKQMTSQELATQLSEWQATAGIFVS